MRTGLGRDSEMDRGIEMKLLIIDHYAGGPGMGSEQRPFYLARELKKRGISVTILAADFSHKRRQNPIVETDFEEKLLDGIPYLFVRTPSYDNSLGGKGRNIHTFIRKCWRHAKELAERCNPDVILCGSSYPYDYFVAKRIAACCSGRIVFELKEIWPVRQKELLEGGRGEMPVRWASYTLDRALAGAAKVVSVLPRGKHYLKERGISEEKCVEIPEAVDFGGQEEPLALRKREFVERIRSSYGFLVLYQGYISRDKALETLVKAAALLQKDDVGILIAGNGSYKINLKRLIRELKVHNVYWMDRIASQERSSLHAMADCLYLGDSRESAGLYGLRSSKLLEYMKSGKPVVTCVRADDTPVTRSGCGVAAKDPGARALSEAIRQIQALSPAQRAEMGQKGRRYLEEHHSLQMLGDRYEKLLKDLVDGKEPDGYNGGDK